MDSEFTRRLPHACWQEEKHPIKRHPREDKSVRRNLFAVSPSSPSSQPAPRYDDRFLPSYSPNLYNHHFSTSPTTSNNPRKQPVPSLFPNGGVTNPVATPEHGNSSSPPHSPSPRPSPLYQMVLSSELLGCKRGSPPRVLQYKHSKGEDHDLCTSPYSSSPISQRSQTILRSPPKTPRKIATTPTRVLQAPAIKDDFYLNLLDWSPQNLLAVALGDCVYLWNASTSQVTRLCNLAPADSVTSVCWTQRGTHLAVGTHKGLVQLWDVSKSTIVQQMDGHKDRVGILAWHDSFLGSASRDRVVHTWDLRQSQFSHKLVGHRQEVCGLRWSPDGHHLASGGNDNKLLVWDIASSSKPFRRFSDHTAAVKAIAWSPHVRGLLASGGGTADRRIRFWDVPSNTALSSIDTGSQVCNLVWSNTLNELVSTHGYSQNQVALWSYPSMTQLASLTGHATRVLYLALSPDGQTVVTGAGDETLRFWNVFPSSERGTRSVRTSYSFQKLKGAIGDIR
ncbi:Protein FIZZY-RELATED 2 [Balamuthia mandrillaris]